MSGVVVTQAQPIELAGHVRDVVLGVDSRMLAGLAGMFSAGRPKASNPMVCNTLKPDMRLKRA